MCPTEIIVVDTNADARKMALEIGADHAIDALDDPISAIKDLTGGLGAHAVLDFVAEHGTTETGPNMIRNGGTYYVVGYGGRVDIPALRNYLQRDQRCR